MKLGYWLAAWGATILIAFLINPQSIRTAIFFPIGLLALLPNGEHMAIFAGIVGGWIVGWIFYIVLSVVLFCAKKSNHFFLIYIIFCILLALNVAGCQEVSQAVSKIE